MTTGSPLRHILLFAAPMMIGTVFQQLYNVADMFIVGNVDGSRALAAIGATRSATFFLLALTLGLSTAYTAVMSQYFGAKNEKMVRKTLVGAIYITVFCVAVFSLVGIFGVGPLMRLLGTPEDIIDGSVLYLRICIGLSVGQLVYNTAAAVLQAVGDSRTPLFFLIMASVLNILLDLLFVMAFGMGVAGAAIATVISQMLSAAACVIYIYKRFIIFRIHREDFHFEIKSISEIARIGIPMGFQSMLLGAGEMVVTMVVNSFGTDIVAAFSAGARIQNFAMMLCLTLSQAVAVYAGQNLGAGRIDRIKEGFKKITIVTVSFSLISAAFIYFYGASLTRAFISDSDVHIDQIAGIASEYLRAQAYFFVFLGVIWLYNNTLRGMGDVVVPLFSGLIELAAKVGFSILFGAVFGYIGVWYAGPLGWALGFVPTAIRYHSGGWVKMADKFKEVENFAEEK